MCLDTKQNTQEDHQITKLTGLMLSLINDFSGNLLRVLERANCIQQ